MLKLAIATLVTEEDVELSILCLIVLLSIGVVGDDAAPIKSGRAKRAPTTMKTAIATYDRGPLKRDLGFEGEALLILGFLLED